MTDEIPVVTKRATMYAVRATGRAIARAAKSRAPVYKGTDPRATAESGNLRKSIKNARRLRTDGDIYELKVGPFGTKKQGTAVVRYDSHGNTAGYARATGHNAIRTGSGGHSTEGQVRGVQLYRGQMEDLYGYMRTGIELGDATAKEIFEAAYAKAWAKWMARV